MATIKKFIDSRRYGRVMLSTLHDYDTKWGEYSGYYGHVWHRETDDRWVWEVEDGAPVASSRVGGRRRKRTTQGVRSRTS